MILGISGHRPQKIGGFGENPLRGKVRQKMREFFVEHKPSLVLTGMALGVDQWAAELAISLKIPFHAYVPFQGQEAKWPLDQQAYYGRLLQAAGKVIYCTNPGYATWKMQRRNELLVDACGHLLAVFDGSPGGTANCIVYAEQKKRPITMIDPSALNATKGIK